MSREIRKVHKDWKHPKEYNHYRGEYVYKPLLEYSWYKTSHDEWVKAYNEGGLQVAIDEIGMPPNLDDYMPNWSDDEATHYQMYEDTSEGTPISPPLETPEAVAKWCVDNNASIFGTDQTADYETWLYIAKGGWGPSMVIIDGKSVPGAEFMAKNKEQS